MRSACGMTQMKWLCHEDMKRAKTHINKTYQNKKSSRKRERLDYGSGFL